ncbi:MAG TPA: hypothetical protein VGL81_01435 [Polyangiaceae bacterium]|jgi:hypothetical protein
MSSTGNPMTSPRDTLRDQKLDLEDLRDERDEIVLKCRTQGYTERRRRRLEEIDQTIARLSAAIASAQ